MKQAVWILMGALTACMPPVPKDAEDVALVADDPVAAPADPVEDPEPAAEPPVDALEDEDPAPAIPEDDCSHPTNDTFQTAAQFEAIGDIDATGFEICEGDLDYVRIDIPPGMYASLEIVIDGSGRGDTDLDLWEVDAADEVLQYSASEQSYERLAWFNDTTTMESHWLKIDGWEGAVARYQVVVRTSPMHDDKHCDAAYPTSDPDNENGPCNEILQFPQTNSVDDGYWVSHSMHYSNLRRELIYLVRDASRATAAAFPNTNPLGLMDMSERGGATPGEMVDNLRHPAGSHIRGNDIDIAYYQVGGDNYGRPVCENDSYFCTDDAPALDAPRTAYFIAMMLDTPHARVIGVDPVIYDKIVEAAATLVDEGLLTDVQAGRFEYRLAHGSGWPFHHHHLHFSWQWEQGWWRGEPEGCLVDVEASEAMMREYDKARR